MSESRHYLHHITFLEIQQEAHKVILNQIWTKGHACTTFHQLVKASCTKTIIISCCLSIFNPLYVNNLCYGTWNDQQTPSCWTLNRSMWAADVLSCDVNTMVISKAALVSINVLISFEKGKISPPEQAWRAARVWTGWRQQRECYCDTQHQHDNGLLRSSGTLWKCPWEF